ncbi:MAG TPA: hypothetical protein VLF15_11685 [Pseudoxanthomonas sp.]|nr:hypothetical protein [Pseudoxanthomonas sp.]
MFARQFHFNSFRSSFASSFAPRKPRHPLLRLAVGLLGLAVLCVLVFFSVFVGAAMIAGGLLYRLFRQRGKPVARDGNVVDGEYRVVSKPVLPLSR